MVRLLFSDKSGSENRSVLGSVNINLDEHARQDQVARISRATVAKAMTRLAGRGDIYITGTPPYIIIYTVMIVGGVTSVCRGCINITKLATPWLTRKIYALPLGQH